MKITIDVSQILYGTGVSVYTKMLVRHLLSMDNENSYNLFGGSLRRFTELKSMARKLQVGHPNVTHTVLPLAPSFMDILWNRIHLVPLELIVGRTDVYHSSDWLQAPSKAFKVTTVHDLSPIIFPELSDPKIVRTHRNRLSWVKAEVDRVIVPSLTTQNDLINLGFKRERIRVIPEAVDPELVVLLKKNSDRPNKNGKYLLAVGVNKRKNTQRIIDAFNKVKKKFNLKLVVVGHPYIDVPKSDDIVFTGHISQEKLANLYLNAQALIYPSLYEGFGLPILEAFAAKVPVVTSNIGSMKEVAGNAAILVDAFNINSISNGMVDAIKKRSELVKRGSSISSQYSWKKTAEKTLEVYKEFS